MNNKTTAAAAATTKNIYCERYLWI